MKFETVDSKIFEYGKNNFIEIARKKVTETENENEFIQISKGFFDQDGNKRYKSGVGIPDNPEVKAFVIESIRVL